MKKTNQTIVLIYSEECNFNCVYCLQKDNTLKYEYNDKDLIKYIIKKSKDTNIQIDFMGGEPLIHFDKIKTLIEQTINIENISYSVPTNGVLLDDNKLEFLTTHNCMVSVSYDGANINKLTRQHIEDTVISKYDPTKVSIHTVISPQWNDNLYDIGDVYYDTKSRFPQNKISMNITREDTWGNNHLKLITGLERFSKIVVSKFKDNEITTIPPIFETILSRIGIISRYYSPNMFMCGYGVDTLTIYPEDDDIKEYGCHLFKKNQINPNDIKWTSKCETCEIEKICSKGCPAENIKNGTVPDSVCMIYKAQVKETLYIMNELKCNKDFIYYVNKLHQKG